MKRGQGLSLEFDFGWSFSAKNKVVLKGEKSLSIIIGEKWNSLREIYFQEKQNFVIIKIRENKEGLKLERKIIFIDDCMKECHVIDKEVLKEALLWFAIERGANGDQV